jgi:hypothetical protein
MGTRTCNYNPDNQLAVSLDVAPTDDKDWKTDYDFFVRLDKGSNAAQFGDAYMSTFDVTEVIGVRRGNVKVHLEAGPAGLVPVPQLQALMTAILANWDRLT